MQQPLRHPWYLLNFASEIYEWATFQIPLCFAWLFSPLVQKDPPPPPLGKVIKPEVTCRKQIWIRRETSGMGKGQGNHNKSSFPGFFSSKPVYKKYLSKNLTVIIQHWHLRVDRCVQNFSCSAERRLHAEDCGSFFFFLHLGGSSSIQTSLNNPQDPRPEPLISLLHLHLDGRSSAENKKPSRPFSFTRASEAHRCIRRLEVGRFF